MLTRSIQNLKNEIKLHWYQKNGDNTFVIPTIFTVKNTYSGFPLEQWKKKMVTGGSGSEQRMCSRVQRHTPLQKNYNMKMSFYIPSRRTLIASTHNQASTQHRYYHWLLKHRHPVLMEKMLPVVEKEEKGGFVELIYQIILYIELRHQVIFVPIWDFYWRLPGVPIEQDYVSPGAPALN